MTRKIVQHQTFDEKLEAKRAAYAQVYRTDELNDANDASTLDMLLKTEIMISDLQQQIQELMAESSVEQANNIKKLADLLRDATNTTTALQKTLSIDRKTRKSEETASVADYIRALKRDAHEFMEQRVIRVYCDACKVMVGRIFPVHDHTAFAASFECSQCHKLIRARREERDVLFDIRDKQWREKYKPEVIQPKKFTRIAPENDELILDGDLTLVEDEAVPDIDVHTVQDDLELGG